MTFTTYEFFDSFITKELDEIHKEYCLVVSYLGKQEWNSTSSPILISESKESKLVKEEIWKNYMVRRTNLLNKRMELKELFYKQ